MLQRYCCPKCIGDHGLQSEIIPSRSNRKGKCDFCGSDNVDLIEPSELCPEFEIFLGAYEKDQNGILLAEWMKSDWGLFTHPKMDMANAQMLLAEILDDDDIVRKRFSPSSKYDSQTLVQWETLRDELMHGNRWFLDDKSKIDTDRLAQLIVHVVQEVSPGSWHRARVLAEHEQCFSLDKMGPPPQRKATNGRANPAGIPYLYLGSTTETATSEIRPHTGDNICIASFEIPKIKVVDLQKPRKLVSPFYLSESSAIDQLRSDLPFLERLGDELTRPVLPQGAAIDYLPSQYLCEFIKKEGYDGVLYRSSVSDGVNLALFDPEKAIGKAVKRYQIKKVSVESEELLDSE
ncbi:RES family NAD+ phosphorylase [Magnetococcus sp. PR-3]|uniref:RES family NAD+ phosphorylase n=1 Tax=Magnetococcus sp. PR-3 TaxID=3120355 RepID=UPI002FCE6082